MDKSIRRVTRPHHVVGFDLNRKAECEHDEYGRSTADNTICKIPQLCAKEDFTLTLPEDTYHVRKTTSYERTTSNSGFPDQIFLQFFTWKASFHVVPATDEMVNHSDRRVSLGAGLRRCHIMNQHGDKCGPIVVDTE